jgi:hypothetical protein
MSHSVILGDGGQEMSKKSFKYLISLTNYALFLSLPEIAVNLNKKARK